MPEDEEHESVHPGESAGALNEAYAGLEVLTVETPPWEAADAIRHGDDAARQECAAKIDEAISANPLVWDLLNDLYAKARTLDLNPDGTVKSSKQGPPTLSAGPDTSRGIHSAAFIVEKFADPAEAETLLVSQERAADPTFPQRLRSHAEQLAQNPDVPPEYVDQLLAQADAYADPANLPAAREIILAMLYGKRYEKYREIMDKQP